MTIWDVPIPPYSDGTQPPAPLRRSREIGTGETNKGALHGLVRAVSPMNGKAKTELDTSVKRFIRR